MFRSPALLRPLARAATRSARPAARSATQNAATPTVKRTAVVAEDMGATEIQGRTGARGAASNVCPCCFGAVHKQLRMSSNPSLDPYFRSFSTRSAGGASVIDLIKQEHREAESVFAAYERATDAKTKLEHGRKLTKMLSQHGAQEEMTIYPWMKKRDPKSVGKVDHAIEEHQRLKEDLYRLDKQDAHDAQYDQTMRRVWNDLSHHIKEEESDVLPSLQRIATASELVDLGKSFLSMKNIAPTRPHPMAPAQGGPATMAANAGAAVVDNLRDAARSMMDKNKK